MKNIYVKIEGIHCGHCVSKITKELLNNKKIRDVFIKNNIASITYKGKLDKKEIIDIIKGIDYFTKEDYISYDLKDIDDSFKLREFIIILGCVVLFGVFIRVMFGFNIFNMIPTIDSSITYGMLVITGFFTSIHCISMCGAINLVASFNNSGNNIKRGILYNSGRVLSYTIIGGIVGLIGSVLSINDVVMGTIIFLAALIMFLMSLRMLGVINYRFPKIIKFKVKKKPNSAFLLGILNGFMPCGPLQAMQVYALSTGSFMMGALSMFLFGIGTVPLMLIALVVFNLFSGRRKMLVNKVAATLIFILSLVMLNRGLLILNIDVFKVNNSNDEYLAAAIDDDYQVVEFEIGYDSYYDIIVQKDVLVKMIVHVDSKYLTGCNEELVMPEFGIRQKLEVGDNVIEFIPTETGTFTYNCWMNMIKNYVKVIDDKEYFKEIDYE